MIKDIGIKGDYELETGKLIVRTFKNRDYHNMKACLVACHGPFTWGDSADDSVEVAIMLEHIAMLAYRSMLLEGSVKHRFPQPLNRHRLTTPYYSRYSAISGHYYSYKQEL